MTSDVATKPKVTLARRANVTLPLTRIVKYHLKRSGSKGATLRHTKQAYIAYVSHIEFQLREILKAVVPQLKQRKPGLQQHVMPRHIAQAAEHTAFPTVANTSYLHRLIGKNIVFMVPSKHASKSAAVATSTVEAKPVEASDETVELEEDVLNEDNSDEQPPTKKKKKKTRLAVAVVDEETTDA